MPCNTMGYTQPPESSTPSKPTLTHQPHRERLTLQPNTPHVRSANTCSERIMSSSALHASTTPPPTSRCPSLRSKASKNLDPDSPPITVMNSTRRESSVPLVRPMPDLVQAATIEELREMVNKMWNENLKLEAIASEARMSAAHYKLHYSLLSIESQEALNRMGVENTMFRREAAIMRHNPLDPAQLEYNKKLKEYCMFLKEDHFECQRRLKKARHIAKIQDRRLVRAQQVISLLQERIRENRKHVTEMRNGSGPFYHGLTSMIQPETPQAHHCSTHRRNSTPTACNPLCKHSESSTDHREKFNALILAGSLLQENKNHSSSAIPLTRLPNTSQVLNQDLPSSFCSKSHKNSCISNTALLPPVQFTPEVEARIKSRSLTQSQSRTRRRKSRDSTISASDAEEICSYQTTSNSGKTKDLFSVDESKLYALRAGFGKPIGYNSRSNTGSTNEICNQDKDSIDSSRIISAVKKRKRDEELTKWDNDRKNGKSREQVGMKIGC